MFLKYLELYGFKSFPDKIRIEMHDGITGIVGPNGSGKSNVSDAIRWVLGEQSIRQLRGGKMEDVIFAGTETRKPMGFAEASVCFDNTESLFPIDYAEVLITRRLFRSGESEYYINKSACRLKDIHELLMDTGMGRDGYSVVGQGKIVDIISSKPEDRRTIFEEAAGISKYKYRKAESERKMQQTQENILRLLDLLSEIESHLPPLEIESQKAKQYLAYKEELKDVEIALMIDNIAHLKEDIQRVDQNIETNQSAQKQLETDMAAFEEKMAALAQSAKAKEEEQNRKTQEYYQKKALIQEHENKISLLRNSQTFHGENIQRLKDGIAQLKTACEALQTQLETYQKEDAALSEQLSAQNSALEDLQKTYDTLHASSEKEADEYELCNQNILTNMQLLAERKTELASTAAAIESLKNKMLSAQEDVAIKEEDLEKNKSLQEKEEKSWETAKARLREKEEALSSVKDTAEALRADAARVTEARNRLDATLQALDARKKSLEELERDMEGYAHSVKTVISESKNGKLSHVGILGTVSQVIKTPPAYVTAIEAALGGALQNIITETEKDAQTAIEYLKATKSGRATFLPVSAVSGKVMANDLLRKEDGYIGIASELVTYDAKYSGIIRELLGRTAVISSMNNGVKISRKYKQQYKLVTLEGEIFNPGGAMTGGNLGKHNGFLSRGLQIQKLEEEIQKTEQERKTVLEELEKINLQSEKLDSEIHEKEQLLSQESNQLYKFEYNLEYYQKHALELTEELNGLNNAVTFLKTQIEAANEEKIRQEGELEETENLIAQLREKVRSLQESNISHTSQAQTYNQRIIQKTLEISDLEHEKQVLENRLRQSEQELVDKETEIVKLSEELDSTGRSDQELFSEMEQHEQTIAALQQALSELDLAMKDVQDDRAAIEAETIEQQQESKAQNERNLLLAKEQVRLENQKTKYETELEAETARLWEDYELTYVTALPLKKESLNRSETKKQVKTLRNAMRELGNVNIAAIDEYKETKERYDFLTNQKNDLDDAKKTLENVISDMETLMTKQFKSQLAIINEAFSRVFRDLFSGGTAELVLTDETDVLSAGVEIVAQPPGKTLQNMSLFSGGEKAIIAIALLFALLEVRPSPLCVLDEIEAALDDVNVARFAAYLRKISHRSQIAIITHRRGTMEEADRLYGVTMQEKGVSKLLQLDIDEIEKTILKGA